MSLGQAPFVGEDVPFPTSVMDVNRCFTMVYKEDGTTFIQKFVGLV